ncbi:hypothetical protein [Rhodohalobacter sp. 8-1]|uniref:hypothetical protein n=1 Tax=Rhodohalobacter sp. 8-1 TaxID=3131972 RepID=UPI0030ED56BF
MGKGIVFLLLLAMSLLASGKGDESFEIVSLSYSLELQKINPFYVTAGMLLAWLGVLGLMCLYLEKIPGTALYRKRKQTCGE